MRPVLLAALVLAGCLSGPSEDAPLPVEPPAAEAAPSPLVADAPDLPPGRAFTFRDEYLYDAEERITVVVAEADAEGYLLAGASEADVASAAVWGRSWFGRVDRHLSLERLRLFDFPLQDGKAWEMRDGLAVTARAADVATPAGAEPGFVVEGTDGRAAVRLQYAPSLGYYTEYVLTIDGAPFLRLTLEKVGTSASFVHWEVGAEAETGDGAAAPLQVPAGQDAVLVSLGGARGGRAMTAPPPARAADAWMEEFPTDEAWRVRAFPAHEGAWSLAAASPPGGFGYARAVSVTWIRGQVG